MIDGERLATPSGVAAVLEAYGFAARKSLGQNFLIDRNVLGRVVDAGALHEDDVVLEIGPGLGVLTRELSRRCRRVLAVEIDSGFVEWLERLFQAEPTGDRVHVVHGDALDVDLNALLLEHPPGPGGAYKAIANLPYYITSPLLMRLLEDELPLTTVVVMVQREVARRMTAEPGTKDYGALSVAVQLRAAVDVAAVVPPGAFYPAPAVESAVVRLQLQPFPEEVADAALLRATVRAAFGQRRKTVRNAWRHAAASAAGAELPTNREGLLASLDDGLRASGIDGRRRGETLTPLEFIRVANEFAPRGITFPT